MHESWDIMLNESQLKRCQVHHSTYRKCQKRSIYGDRKHAGYTPDRLIEVWAGQKTICKVLAQVSQLSPTVQQFHSWYVHSREIHYTMCSGIFFTACLWYCRWTHRVKRWANSSQKGCTGLKDLPWISPTLIQKSQHWCHRDSTAGRSCKRPTWLNLSIPYSPQASSGVIF